VSFSYAVNVMRGDVSVFREDSYDDGNQLYIDVEQFKV
jgi:hypothetical protein